MRFLPVLSNALNISSDYKKPELQSIYGNVMALLLFNIFSTFLEYLFNMRHLKREGRNSFSSIAIVPWVFDTPVLFSEFF